MHEETVYDALANAHDDDGHWAFGTGFDDPLAGVDTTVPDGVDPADLGAYCLMLGDDALVLAQRLTAVDHRRARARGGGGARQHRPRPARPGPAAAGPRRLGRRARPLARAGRRDSIPDEDALAYFRDPDEFRCTALVEAPERRLRADDGPAAGRRRPCGWRCSPGCADSRDPVLAAIAAKGVARARPTTATTPRRWLLRLGDGTDGVAPPGAGRRRRRCGRCSPTLFTATDVERRLAAAGVAVDPADLRDEVRDVLTEVLRAGDAAPCRTWPADAPPRGRLGEHGPELAELLADAAGRWPASTRRRPGERRWRADDRRRPRGRWPSRSPTPSCRCSPSPTSACCATCGSRTTARVVVEITPTYTGCPAMGVMRADLVHALHRGRLRRRRRPHRALPRLDAPTGSATTGRRKLAAGRHRPARPGAGPRAPARSRCSSGPPAGRPPARCAARADTEELSEFGATACKALRRCRSLPRAVRAREGDLSDRRPSARQHPPPAAVPPADRRRGGAAHRRRRRGHLRRPRRTWPRTTRSGPARRSPCAGSTATATSAARTRSARPMGAAAAGRRPRGARRLLLLLAGARGAARATRSRCCRRRARSPPTCRCPATTCSSSPGSGHHPGAVAGRARCCATASRRSPSSTATAAPTRSCSPTSWPT